MRSTPLGRKNDLFAGSDTGGDRAASMYTIMQTAELNDVNPEAHLHGTLTRIAGGHPINRIGELMPWTRFRKEPSMRTRHASEQLSFGREFDIEPTHRLFFGIWPDDGAIDRLTRLMARLRNDKIMPGRPVDADRLHVTLHHLGDFGNQVPPSLVPNASMAAETIKMQPFSVTFDRAGGTRGKFLLRPSNEPAALMEFRKTLSTALVKAGVRNQVKTAFSPHVTLSYDFSDVPEQQAEPITWTVNQFVLIESLLGKHQHVKRGSWQVRS